MKQQQLIDDLLECTNEANGLLTELEWLICDLIPDDDKPETEALKKHVYKLANCQEEIESVFVALWEILNDARVKIDLRRIAQADGVVV